MTNVSENLNDDHPDHPDQQAADNGAHGIGAGDAAEDTAVKSDLLSKPVYTTGEAAEVCKVSQQTIIRCFDKGRLHGFRVPGSRFRRIPRAELIQFMRENGIPFEHMEGGKRKILVVDDDPQIVELFVDMLGSDKRFEVHTALTGYDAGLMTEQVKPELIILDYMLPDINGNVVCKTIRDNATLAGTKIIIVSGVVNRDEVQDLMNAGADAFVKKPFNLDELLGQIGELLDIETDLATGSSRL